jgi:hypothetical protein
MLRDLIYNTSEALNAQEPATKLVALDLEVFAFI